MQSYRLRHRIDIQCKQKQKDADTGAVIYQWVDAVADDGTVLSAVPAEVLTGPGRELVASGAPHVQVDARINLRWFPMADTALAECRVLWDGRIFDITSVSTDVTAAANGG